MKQPHHELVKLASDNDTVLTFSGRLFSESSYYDEDASALTCLRLYVTETGSQVYSVIRSFTGNKSRAYYEIKILDSMCEISDGTQIMSLPLDLLFNAVFGLCGIDPEYMESIRASFEEAFAAAQAG